jgi:RNA polymerase sigma-70 factor (ECF subfamily)
MAEKQPDRDPLADEQWLAERFDQHRSELRAVAYRMLGSLTEADDAIQEVWIRLSRSSADEIGNLGAWLTTVVGRVCLNMLRTRSRRREDSMPIHMPDPIVVGVRGSDPEQQALLADSVGLALLVVLETLRPDERLAFVLHDMFAVPFDDIAAVIGCSPVAARQHASRARRRVRGEAPPSDVDLAGQRKVVDAFFAAARNGDFDALVAVLDPDVVVRSDGGNLPAGAAAILHGAAAVAAQALTYARLAPFVRPAIVNGAAGVVVAPGGKPFSVMVFTIRHGRIFAIDALSDQTRLAQLDLAVLDDQQN